MKSLPSYIFIAVIMSSVGYMATRTKNFNIWKMGLLAFIAAPIIMSLENSETAAWVAVTAFFAGYLFPHAHILDGFFGTISDLVNSVRYRDDRRRINSQKEELRRREEELRRQEEELERLRRAYEEAMRNSQQSQQHSEEKNSQGGRQYEKGGRGKHEDFGRKKSGDNTNSRSNTRRQPDPDSKRTIHLKALGLDLNKQYSEDKIKIRKRMLLQKYHPDKHYGKSAEELHKVNEKTQEIIQAADWLERNPDE